MYRPVMLESRFDPSADAVRFSQNSNISMTLMPRGRRVPVIP